MSNQLQITGGAKVRNLEGAIVGSSGVLTSVGLGVANGVATLGTDGKVPSSQLPTLASSYKGTWNAATNTPTIADGVGTAGDYYLVSTGGVWNGITFTEGQTVIYSGTIWQKAGGASGVTSVALTAPAAFTVSGSPVVSTGTLALNAAGTSAQYISGAGTLVSFPTDLVTTSRTVNTTSPLLGGGALSSNLTLTIQQSTTTQNGYLSSTDFNTFAGKENVLTFYSPLNKSGSSVTIPQATSAVDGFLDSADWVIFNNKQNALSGTGIVKSTAGTISYLTDNTANWDTAYNNSIVSAAVTGTTTKTLTLTQQDAGTITASWTDLTTNLVTSVFGRTGAIVATTGDYATSQVTEIGNLYYTNARARAAISLTTTGASGSSTYDNINGVLNVPTYSLSGLGGQPQLNGTGFVRAAGTTITYDNTSYTPTSRTLTINGVAQDLSANRSWDILTMVYPGAGIAVSTGTAWGTSITDNSSNWNAAYAARIVTASSPLSFSGNTLSIAQSSTTVNGYLSSTDFNTFNNKINGSLTAGKMPFATGTNSLGDTNVNYNGGLVGFGTAADTYRVSVAGSVNVTGSYYVNGVALSGNYLPLTGGTLTGDITYSPGDATDWFIKSPVNGPNLRLRYSIGTTNRSGALAWVDNSGVKSDVLLWVDNLITANVPITGSAATFSSSVTASNIIKTTSADQSAARIVIQNTDATGKNVNLVAGDPNTSQSGFSIAYDNTNILRFENSGDATFAASVSATQAVFKYASNPLTIASTNTTLYQTFKYNTTTDAGYIGNGLGISSTGVASDFGMQSVANMIFSTGGSTERMRISSLGRLLVGTTSDPGYMINAAGTINTSSVFRSSVGFMNSYEGYNNWELGTPTTTTGLTLKTTSYVTVRINGSVYKLATVN